MSFAGARARMNDAIFARMGEDATWTGLADPVRVIPREQDEDVQFSRALVLQRVSFLRVRKSDVAAPAIGDEIGIASLSVTYRVVAEPVLQRHLVWICEVELVTAP